MGPLVSITAGGAGPMRRASRDGDPVVLGLPEISHRRDFLETCARQAIGLGVDRAWVECGVFAGASARMLAHVKPPPTALHLFDSWEGLPEDWDKGDSVTPQGRFRCAVPDFHEPNVVIHRGLFAETLPLFRPTSPLGLIHLDCDLYTSARTVLTELTPWIRSGTVLIFDEVWGYPRWAHDEWRALQEWQASSGRSLDWRWRGDAYRAAGVVRDHP